MRHPRRALLIDPEKRTIEEIRFEGDYKKIQELLGCASFTGGSRPLNGSLEAGFDTLYVSDDELDERDDPRFWFQVDADRDPPSSFPIAGRGLVIGVDIDGKDCDARISLDELTARISFTRRKFRGFTFGERPDGIEIGLKAPIIDDQ